MMEILNELSRLAVLAFLVTSLSGIGLDLTIGGIVTPLRNPAFVAGALLANFLIAPLLAIFIARLLRLDEPFAIGLLLLGLGAGAPFMPKVIGLAGGDLALSVGLMVLLMVGTMVLLPVALPLFVKGAVVDPWEIVRYLFLLMFMPIIAGLAVRAKLPAFAARLRPWLERISSWASLVVIILIVAVHFEGVMHIFGTRAILAALLFGTLTASAGWLLGGRGASRGTELGLATGLRNVPAALIVSMQNFKDHNVTVMVIVSTLVGIALLVPVAIRIGKGGRGTGRSAPNH